mgnify:CR=1 FL=1
MTPNVPPNLSKTERLERLRLARSENVGPVTFHQLLSHYGSAASALDALPELAARGGRTKRIQIMSQAAAEREWSAVEKIGGRILFCGETEFPPLLAVTEPPPPLIAVLGHPHLLHQKTLAMVGSRNASATGMRLAATLARELGEAGYVIVSGLARGIDTAAHKAALATGTAAVLGCGLDIIYPEQNAGLYAAIRDQGVLISEMPLGAQPQARAFPRRNRLISGLCRAVIVVEAALRSGSLITARFANEQGRDVFAVPGSPLDPRARGANGLLKQGAALIETAEDVLAALETVRTLDAPMREPVSSDFTAAQPPAIPEPDDTDRRRLLDCLSATPTEIDEIIRHTGLPASTVNIMVLELDLAGRLEHDIGQKVSLIDPKAACDHIESPGASM